MNVSNVMHMNKIFDDKASLQFRWPWRLWIHFNFQSIELREKLAIASCTSSLACQGPQLSCSSCISLPRLTGGAISWQHIREAQGTTSQNDKGPGGGAGRGRGATAALASLSPRRAPFRRRPSRASHARSKKKTRVTIRQRAWVPS